MTCISSPEHAIACIKDSAQEGVLEKKIIITVSANTSKRSYPGRKAMTVCIAAICERKNAVVVASDRMITVHSLSLEYEHPDPKFESLSDYCVGLTAGDALAHTELFRECRRNIYKLKSPQVGEIASTVKEQYIELRKKKAEEIFFATQRAYI